MFVLVTTGKGKFVNGKFQSNTMFLNFYVIPNMYQNLSQP